jgi:hypothetical protein
VTTKQQAALQEQQVALQASLLSSKRVFESAAFKDKPASSLLSTTTAASATSTAPSSVIKVTTCKLSNWRGRALFTDKQADIIERRVYDVGRQTTDTRQYRNFDVEAAYEKWYKDCFEVRCQWVDEDDDVWNEFVSYMGRYKYGMSPKSVLVDTFLWDKATVHAKAFFMAERELNLPPFSIMHPLFTKSVVQSDKTMHMLGRMSGSPHNMDPWETFRQWTIWRQDSAKDNGLSARIGKSASCKSTKDNVDEAETTCSTTSNSNTSSNNTHDETAIGPSTPTHDTGDDGNDGDEDHLDSEDEEYDQSNYSRPYSSSDDD